MPLRTEFGDAAGVAASDRPSVKKPRRRAPLSIRLNDIERARVTSDAGGRPLGEYIKSCLFHTTVTARRRPRPSMVDKEAVAKVLAMLGKSHLASNLNQLAKAVNIGALPLTPEVEAELLEAIRDVRSMRVLLMRALGLRTDESIRRL